jgi:DNA repair photolyase
MTIRNITSKRILTPQKRGFLAQGEYPFTHTLAWSVGCGLGKTYCGAYCYAPTLPNWLYNREEGEAWGEGIVIKENAPELLAAELAKTRDRSTMRIFMSSTTDPYQPLERKLRLTRQCLEVFQRYADLDLLLIQTRSPIVTDDAALIAAIPYVWVSMTLETDRADLPYGPNRAMIDQRYAAIQKLTAAGVRVQIAVSPCLPYSNDFADWLIASGAQRIIVDTFVAGDGSEGKRTSTSPFASESGYDWRSEDHARHLYAMLQGKSAQVGWSAAGFSGIPPRTKVMLDM